MKEPTQEIITGDCLSILPTFPAGSFDLVFADPPFGIGYKYDVYDDRTPPREYLNWCRKWMGQVKRVLKPDGTFWLAIGDSYASELDCMARHEYGFYRRSWCLWHYTFGVNSPKKFTPSHTHLFHYVCGEEFTFNADAVKVPSMRQIKYGDRRAKEGGRLPNDVWVLDSKAASDEGKAFNLAGDVWCESRVCGTFKERERHPCQTPVSILERIIRVSSNPGDSVLDPFSGSGVTAVAAQNLGRNAVGIELSAEYAEQSRKRLAAVAVG